MSTTTYRLGATERVTLVAATSAASSAIGTAGGSDGPADARIVRVQTDVDCFALVSLATAATVSNGFPVAADTYEYIDVPPGHKIAFIAAEVGFAYVTATSKK
mgnify:CR=1 FL=1